MWAPRVMDLERLRQVPGLEHLENRACTTDIPVRMAVSAAVASGMRRPGRSRLSLQCRTKACARQTSGGAIPAPQA